MTLNLERGYHYNIVCKNLRDYALCEDGKFRNSGFNPPRDFKTEDEALIAFEHLPNNHSFDIVEFWID